MPSLSLDVIDWRPPKAATPESPESPAPELQEGPNDVDKVLKNGKRALEDTAKEEGAPAEKAARLEQQQLILQLPIEIIQTLQQLNSPKPSNNGQLTRPKSMRFEDGRLVLPVFPPLQQCQQLQQIQTLIQYHEQQVKYRSYMQLETLRQLRKQLSDQMMLHPTRDHYQALVDMSTNSKLNPLSAAEKAQIDYFTSMADWTLEARALLQDKETPFYLFLFGRQVSDLKSRLNEITTHEQFQVFAPIFAERIDYHRELIHTLNRRSLVSLL